MAMRFRLRTLLIVLALGPPMLGWMIVKGIQLRDAWLRMQSSNSPRIVPSGTFPIMGPGLQRIAVEPENGTDSNFKLGRYPRGG